MTAQQIPYPQVVISNSVIEETTTLLQSAGDYHSAHEKVVYWCGSSQPGLWTINSCIAPRLESTWGSYNTSARANAEVISELGDRGLELLCQVHSHPGYLVGHSRGDDLGAFMPYDGFLSIVVPVYGTEGILPLRKCGVHRYEKGQFRRLGRSEINRLFSIYN